MRRNFIPDQTLTDELYQSNAEAFEELYRRHWYSLYSYCFSKLKSHTDAKCVVKNIFISLWQKRNELPVTFSLSSYLYTQVRSEVVKCINAKMNTESEDAFIEEQIIPGFSEQELAKASMPVSYKEFFSGHNHSLTKSAMNIPKEILWIKNNPMSSFKRLKHSLQTMLNF